MKWIIKENDEFSIVTSNSKPSNRDGNAQSIIATLWEDAEYLTITEREEEVYAYSEYEIKMDENGDPVYKVDEQNQPLLDEHGELIPDLIETKIYDTVTHYDHVLNESLKTSSEESKAITEAEIKMRHERDELLLKTDYLMTVDMHDKLTEQQKTDVKAYRQALRDLPENTPDARSVVYPTKPIL